MSSNPSIERQTPGRIEEPLDPYELARFVEAQETNYGRALSELRAGKKRSHWSWYVLPQLHGLGSSPMSVRYAIRSLGEAKAYLEHPLLGARLRECVAAMNSHTGPSARDVLGQIDARKFCSCLTLFAQTTSAESLFTEALDKYFSGRRDAATLAILASQQGAGRGAAELKRQAARTHPLRGSGP